MSTEQILTVLDQVAVPFFAFSQRLFGANAIERLTAMVRQGLQIIASLPVVGARGVALKRESADSFRSMPDQYIQNRRRRTRLVANSNRIFVECAGRFGKNQCCVLFDKLPAASRLFAVSRSWRHIYSLPIDRIDAQDWLYQISIGIVEIDGTRVPAK